MRITPKQVFSLLFFPQQIAQVPLYITSTLISWKKGWLSNEMKHLNHQYANKWHKERKKWKWSRMWIVKTIHWMATLDMILIYKNISKGAAFHQKKKKSEKNWYKRMQRRILIVFYLVHLHWICGSSLCPDQVGIHLLN